MQPKIKKNIAEQAPNPDEWSCCNRLQKPVQEQKRIKTSIVNRQECGCCSPLQEKKKIKKSFI